MQLKRLRKSRQRGMDRMETPSDNSLWTDIGPRSAFPVTLPAYSPHGQSGPTIGHRRNVSCHYNSAALLVLLQYDDSQAKEHSIDASRTARCSLPYLTAKLIKEVCVAARRRRSSSDQMASKRNSS